MSQSIHIATFSNELKEFIQKNIKISENNNSFKKYDEEPYRLALSIILEKFINDSYEIETIISDLNMVLISLIENRGTNKEIRKLSLLVESLKVGGFVTAEMDIREDSAVTTNAAKEIISKIYDQNTTIQDAINLIEKNN